MVDGEVERHWHRKRLRGRRSDCKSEQVTPDRLDNLTVSVRLMLNRLSCTRSDRS